jgi:putative FmdB family regulatory protein
MPTYEFRCPNGHEFERFYRKISDAASELPCPECGAAAERQLSAGAGLLFKGSGFYLTDYGKNAHRKAGPAAAGKTGEGKAEGATTGSEGKTGDAKPTDAKASTGESRSEKSTTSPKTGGSSGGDKS